MRAVLVTAAVFIVLSAALYGRVLNAPFVYDDALIQLSSLLHASSLSRFWDILTAPRAPRRVGLLSFAFNFLLGGLDPFGYHAVNVAIHVLNGTLLFCLGFLLLRLARTTAQTAGEGRVLTRAAFAGAVVWFVHPVHTQAVTYIYQRYTSLCTLFYLSSLTLYVLGRVRYGTRRWACYAGSVVAGLLALGTKEIAGTLPVFVLIIELIFFRHVGLRLDRRSASYLAVGFALMAVISRVYLGPQFTAMMAWGTRWYGFTPVQRTMTELRVVVHYVSLLVWPHPSRLNLDYDFSVSRSLLDPPSTLLCLALLAGAAAVAAHQIRRRPLLAFAIVWFLGQLVIESSFIPLDLVYEHRLYLPSAVPLALLGGWVWRALPWPVVARGAVFVGWVALWGLWTFQRNHVWQDPIALFEDNAAKSPGKARVHANLGKAYLDRGRYEEARRSSERAIQLDPNLVGAYNNLAVVYLDHDQDWARARFVLQEALARDPRHVESLAHMGVLCLRQRRPAEALPLLKQAVALEPTSPAGLYNLGAAYLNLGQYDQAIEVLMRGIGFWPADARFYALLGLVYYQRQDRARAEVAFREALRVDPLQPMARLYLGRLGSNPARRELPE